MAVKDYKTKYLDMRSKLLESTDVSYRLGFAEGMKAEREQQLAQQQAEAQAMAQAQAQAAGMPPEGGAPGVEGAQEEGVPGEEMPPQEGSMPGMEDETVPGAVSGTPAPGEEEGGGSELDQHIGELESLVSKGEKPSVLTMRKAVLALSEMRKSQKDQWTKKVDESSTSQKNFVNSLLKKWEKEKIDVTENLEEIIQEHGIAIKDE